MRSLQILPFGEDLGGATYKVYKMESPLFWGGDF